ncbi:hypothetical protein FBULB1_9079 [Fusarium bulbicola]|nr:hypothetical protein FBULB1_9079 [Fusarium bulbicola]
MSIKSRMKHANREMNLRERMKLRARAQAFVSEWLVEPHSAAAFVIKEAVSVLWPELRLDLLLTDQPLLESKNLIAIQGAEDTIVFSPYETRSFPGRSPSVAHGISRKRSRSDVPEREDTGTHCDRGTLNSNAQILNDRCELLNIRVKKNKPEKILDSGIAGDDTIHVDVATNPTTTDSTGDRSITDNDLIDGGLIDDGIGDDESICSMGSIHRCQELYDLHLGLSTHLAMI